MKKTEEFMYFSIEQMKSKYKNESLENGAYSGLDLLSLFEEFDTDYKVKIIMNDKVYNSSFIAESWRGSYDLPAIDYIEDNNYEITIEKAIENLETLEGKKVEGWKGGYFILNYNDPVFVANEGDSNDCTAIVGYNIDKENKTLFLLTQPNMY